MSITLTDFSWKYRRKNEKEEKESAHAAMLALDVWFVKHAMKTGKNEVCLLCSLSPSVLALSPLP